MSDFSTLFTGKPSGDGSPSPSRYRILLVDDEPNVTHALRRVFRRENYEIVSAQSGDEALAVMRDCPAQVVISDYQMPGINGAELLRQIKADYPDTIRIMLTGQADTRAVMGAINEGAVFKFILKPWNDDDLLVTVALALEQFDLKRRNQKLIQENQRKEGDIAALTRLAVTNRSQLGIMLHKKGELTANQLQELMRQQEVRKEPLITILLEKGWVTERKIRSLLRTDMLIEEVSPAEFQIDQAVTNLLPRKLCIRQLILPLKLDNRRLTLAMADPLDGGLIEDLRFSIGLTIEAVMADVASIRTRIDEVYGADAQMDFKDLATVVGIDDPFDTVEVVIEDDATAPLEELLHGTEEPPAIRLANAIILEAIRLGASDIHIHPRAKLIVVRYRIDGVLVDKIQFPHSLHQSLVSRLKIMSELDISERRRPQDGRITVKTPFRVVDLRISTLPTINGEKVVMRILDRNAAVLDLAALGFSGIDLPRIQAMMAKPQGIILATGPTGSGKTTTLYSLLQHDASAEKNYVTIEDPVEYYLDSAGQVLIREKIGLTFPLVLRAILRQDPDVILLGEIRDLETAEVAFHAALTGHQVFSTLHTNSAIATVARLLDLGLKPFVIASALEGIIAQRLVRKVCPACAEDVLPNRELLQRLGPAFLGVQRTMHGKGCMRCNGSGYKGRVGLYEIMTIDGLLREKIAAGAGLVEITRLARKQGMRSLHDDAAEKIARGLTTPEEIMRVIGPQTIDDRES